MSKNPISQAAAALGRIKSPAKAAASRENGKKGGRPRGASALYRAARHYEIEIRCKGGEWHQRMTDCQGRRYWGYLGCDVEDAIRSFEGRIGEVNFES